MVEQQIKHTYHHGEVDLFELLSSLWKQKGLILLVTLISTLIGLTYIFLSKPVYEVQARIMPPDAVEIDTLSHSFLKPGIVLKSLNVKTVYDSFTRVLLADSTKYNFFNTVYLPNYPEAVQNKLKRGVLYKQFQNSFTIKEVLKSVPTQYIITIRGHSADKLPQWINHYLSLANKQATEQINSIVNQQQQNILSDLQQEINIAREKAKENRLYRLAQLKEAVKIAEAAGLKEPSQVITGGIIVQSSNLNEPSIMYSRGAKALNAEIKNLNNRESDELFTPKLRQLQSRYDLYKKATINLEGVQMFYLDGVIESPVLPVSPKKNMILVLSVILGLMCGILIGLIKSFFRMKRTASL